MCCTGAFILVFTCVKNHMSDVVGACERSVDSCHGEGGSCTCEKSKSLLGGGWLHAYISTIEWETKSEGTKLMLLKSVCVWGRGHVPNYPRIQVEIQVAVLRRISSHFWHLYSRRLLLYIGAGRYYNIFYHNGFFQLYHDFMI